MAIDFNKKIGRIWVKISKDGVTKYMIGGIHINGKIKKFIAWKNKQKEEDTDQDYNIFDIND